MEVIDFPSFINAGDSIDVTASLANYPAGDGWSVTVVIVNSSNNYCIESVADGDEHDLVVAAADTDDWVAANYKWIAFALKTDKRIQVSSGDIEIRPDILDDVNADLRSHAERTLASIELVIEGKATSDDYSTSVRGKQLVRYNYEDLIKLRNIYRSEVRQEKRSRERRQGKTGANQVRVRF